jgi:hypothetical protein
VDKNFQFQFGNGGTPKLLLQKDLFQKGERRLPITAREEQSSTIVLSGILFLELFFERSRSESNQGILVRAALGWVGTPEGAGSVFCGGASRLSR